MDGHSWKISARIGTLGDNEYHAKIRDYCLLVSLPYLTIRRVPVTRSIRVIKYESFAYIGFPRLGLGRAGWRFIILSYLPDLVLRKTIVHNLLAHASLPHD